MWDVRLVQVLAGQEDLVAWWQLHNLGWAPPVINGWVRRHGWRTIHNGVYAVFRGPLTERQRWIAAILTAPGTYLCAHSVANAYGFHLSQLGYETVVRAGSGGPRMYPGLRVTRSTALEGHTSLVDHIPAVTAELALVQLAGDLDRGQLGRAFRESHRLRHSTADSLAKVLKGQRGTRYLAHLCDRYATIPYHRCRSDAESRGLEILHDAGIEPPAVNVQVNGPRPDFTWRRHKLIIEVDGAQFHEFAEEDAAKAAKWKAVGYRVKRISSDDVYANPDHLVRLYHANVPNLA
jgi:hypothetical protein